MLRPEVFRAYDVRGRVPEEIDASGAYTLGRSFVVYLRGKALTHDALHILIQEDARKSSPDLREGITKGIIAEGAHVIHGGYATTPMHYFSINKSRADAGIMVTASHNLPEYNGFKFSKKEAIPIGYTSGLDEITKIAEREIFTEHDPGRISVRGDLLETYVDFLKGHIQSDSPRKLNVVADLGNGMVGIVMQKLQKYLPIRLHLLNGRLDMVRPKHIANPANESSLHELKNAVLKHKADFGVAFDGDGDRIGFVGSDGSFLRSDYVACWLSLALLKQFPGSTIVHDVRSTKRFPESIVESGGLPIEERVGHAYIKARMRKENAIFGAELSSHFYWKDFFYADSALYTFIYVLNVLVAKEETIESMVKPFMTYASSGEISIPITRTDSMLEILSGAFSDANEVRWNDGLTITYRDWWCNIRESHTEPVLRLNLEAKNTRMLKSKLSAVQAQILKTVSLLASKEK